MGTAYRRGSGIPTAVDFGNAWSVVFLSTITKEIRKGRRQEEKEDKRNRRITELLKGQRCPTDKQVVKKLKGEHK